MPKFSGGPPDPPIRGAQFRTKSRSRKTPMKSKKSVPTSVGFEYANNAKLFCDRLCLYLYIRIRKVGPTIEFTPQIL